MRYVLIGLGVITLALGVILAREGLWFVALPDAAFGLGVAWVAWVSLRDEGHDRGLSQVEVPPAPAGPIPMPPPAAPPPPPTRSGKQRRR
ncbi:MAG: hypothetical protein ACRD1L_08575 [Terriglobales bacterium]